MTLTVPAQIVELEASLRMMAPTSVNHASLASLQLPKVRRNALYAQLVKPATFRMRLRVRIVKQDDFSPTQEPR